MSVPTRLKFPANTHRFYLTKSVLLTYPSFSRSFLMEIVRNFTVLSVRSGRTQRYQVKRNRLRVATFRANLVYLLPKMYCWMGLLVQNSMRLGQLGHVGRIEMNFISIDFQIRFQFKFKCALNLNRELIRSWTLFFPSLLFWYENEFEIKTNYKWIRIEIETN